MNIKKPMMNEKQIPNNKGNRRNRQKRDEQYSFKAKEIVETKPTMAEANTIKLDEINKYTAANIDFTEIVGEAHLVGQYLKKNAKDCIVVVAGFNKWAKTNIIHVVFTKATTKTDISTEFINARFKTDYAYTNDIAQMFGVRVGSFIGLTSIENSFDQKIRTFFNAVFARFSRQVLIGRSQLCIAPDEIRMTVVWSSSSQIKIVPFDFGEVKTRIAINDAFLVAGKHDGKSIEILSAGQLVDYLGGIVPTPIKIKLAGGLNDLTFIGSGTKTRLAITQNGKVWFTTLAFTAKNGIIDFKPIEASNFDHLEQFDKFGGLVHVDTETKMTSWVNRDDGNVLRMISADEFDESFRAYLGIPNAIIEIRPAIN